MLFNSGNFLLFFVSIVTFHYLIPHRFRWRLLLAGSYFFYMCWQPAYALLLLASTVATYLCGLRMPPEAPPRRRRASVRARRLGACETTCALGSRRWLGCNGPGRRLAPGRGQHIFDAGELLTRTSLRPPVVHLYLIETEPVSEREIPGLVLADQLFHLACLRR